MLLIPEQEDNSTFWEKQKKKKIKVMLWQCDQSPTSLYKWWCMHKCSKGKWSCVAAITSLWGRGLNSFHRCHRGAQRDLSDDSLVDLYSVFRMWVAVGTEITKLIQEYGPNINFVKGCFYKVDAEPWLACKSFWVLSARNFIFLFPLVIMLGAWFFFSFFTLPATRYLVWTL